MSRCQYYYNELCITKEEINEDLERDCQYVMTFVAAFHEVRNKDFHNKWLFVNGATLLIQEKYM